MGENKYDGMNGLLAQLATQITLKPSIVVTDNPITGKTVGSGRGTDVYQYLDAYVNAAGLKGNIYYGGHSEACGLSSADKQVLPQLIRFIDDGNKIPQIKASESVSKTFFYDNIDIDTFKAYCHYYTLKVGEVDASSKFVGIIRNYELMGIVDGTSNSGYKFVSIKDDNGEYLNFFAEEHNLEKFLKTEPIPVEIGYIGEKGNNSFFVKNVMGIEKDSTKNLDIQQNLNVEKPKGVNL